MKMQRGFTLTEVIAAIVALAMLVGVAGLIWLIIKVLLHLLTI